jgi:ribosomal protein S18 acetylase RimI-like enzyme
MSADGFSAISFRWYQPSDIKAAYLIEEESHDEPRLMRNLRKSNHVCLVATIREQLAGYLVYRVSPEALEIVDVAVARARRFQGVARALIERVVDNEQHDKNNRKDVLLATVPKSNVPAQKLFEKGGFLRELGVDGNSTFELRLAPPSVEAWSLW